MDGGDEEVCECDAPELSDYVWEEAQHSASDDE